jgi:hypothetical protein
MLMKTARGIDALAALDAGGGAAARIVRPRIETRFQGRRAPSGLKTLTPGMG